MATCDMGYEHERDQGAAEPEIIPVPVSAGPNEHDVQIAHIEADASIAREQIWTEAQALELQSDRDRLAGELKGMREVLDRIAPPAPDPEELPPAPVVIAEPDAGPPEETPPPGDAPPKKSAPKSGYWEGYDQS
jgi:hypothetical protein